MRRQFVVFISFILSFLLNGQELPPITSFSPVDYGGENQNWMASQNSEGFIYVANNMGLLEYNGSDWYSYETPNNTILRSVKVINDLIYTGSDSEFGFWKRNEFGELIYNSLSESLEIKLEDEQIWNIHDYGDWIIFQSNLRLFFYNSTDQSVNIIKGDDNIYKIFEVNNTIYFHVANNGIYKIQSGNASLVYNDEIFVRDRVINMLPSEEGILVLTRDSGFFKLIGQEIVPWSVDSNNIIENISVFSSLKLNNGKIAIGTISDGLILIGTNGELEFQVSQKSGLYNNTVLGIFQDKNGDLWTCLDNGISLLNLNSPFRTFEDYDGKIGTIYTATVFQEKLYLGSNQGLFSRDLNETQKNFEFIEGSAGQVLSLFNDNDDNLLCGHHLGTFNVTPNTFKQISPILGTWNFNTIPNRPNLIMQGNYSGLYLLRKENGSWNFLRKIEGFNISSRYVEFLSENELWINHENKGLINIILNETLETVENLEVITDIPKSKHSGLILYNGDLIFKSKQGTYRLNEASDTLKKDSIFVPSNSNEYSSGKLIKDESGKLWSFSEEYLTYYYKDNVSNTLTSRQIEYPSKIKKAIPGYENITQLNSSKYLIGTTNGYWTLDLNSIDEKYEHTIYLTQISNRKLNAKSISLSLNEIAELDYQNGTLEFKYAVPIYSKLKSINYQYKLDGFMEDWSPWSEKSFTSFENLPFGTYTFKVRSKIGNQLSGNIESFQFKINRPVLLSNTAIIIYIIIFILLVLVTHKAYKRHYTKKNEQEQIRNKQTIIEMRNHQLNQEIEGKNRELAISTMSLIKKNEVLGAIKKELQKDNTVTNNKKVVRLIDKNLQNNSDWEFFKEAFNNADKDFLKNIKGKHPDLTPNDLRFCAYLRLNLSSKEISPLLNISLKSVETKRYRLRKKLHLSHDDGLINYILQF